MTKVDQNYSGVATGMRWSARLMGLGASGLYFLFLVTSGLALLPTLSWASPRGLPMFLVLTLAVVGTLVAWQRQMIGGGLALSGGTLVVALAYAESGSGLAFTALMLALPLLVAGLLHLACAYWTGFRARTHQRGIYVDQAASGRRSFPDAALVR